MASVNQKTRVFLRIFSGLTDYFLQKLAIVQLVLISMKILRQIMTGDSLKVPETATVKSRHSHLVHALCLRQTSQLG
jgi:hypothetical protein